MRSSADGRRLKSRVALGFALFLLVVVVGAVLFWRHAASNDFYFEQLNSQLQQDTGLRLKKLDPLSIVLLPKPTLTVKNPLLIDPLLATDSNTLATAEELAATLHLLPLLRGIVRLDLDIVSPQLMLAVNASGEPNWVGSAQKSTSTDTPDLEIDRVTFSDGMLHYENHQEQFLFALGISKFNLNFTKGAGRALLDSAGRFGDTLYTTSGSANYDTGKRQLRLDLNLAAWKADTVEGPQLKNLQAAGTMAELPLQPLQMEVNGAIDLSQQLPAGELSLSATLSELRSLDYLLPALSTIPEGLGVVTGTGTLEVRGGDIHINELETRLRHAGLEIDAFGDIDDILSHPRLTLDLEGRAKSLAPFASLVDSKDTLLDELGPLHGTARLTGAGGRYALEGLSAELEQELLQLEVSGWIRSLEGNPSLDILLSGSSEDPSVLAELIPKLSKQLQGFKTQRFSARLQGNGGHYDIREMSADLQRPGLSGTLGGEILDLAGHPQIKLLLQGKAGTLGAYPEVLPIKDKQIAALGPFTFDGQLTGAEGKYDLTLQRGEIAAGQVRLTTSGRVESLQETPQFNLDANTEVEDVELLVRLLPQADTYLRKLGKITANGNLNGTPGAFKLKLENAAHHREGLSIQLAGEISNLPNQPIADLEAILEADEPSKLESFFDDLPEFWFEGPLRVTSDVAIRPERVVLQNLAFTTAHSDVKGEIAIEIVDQVPFVQIDIRSDFLDLSATPQERASNTNEEPPSTKPKPAEIPEKQLDQVYRDALKNILIQVDWIKPINGRLRATAKGARLAGREWQGLAIDVGAGQGKLVLEKFNGELEEGPISLRGSIDAASDPPRFTVSGELHNNRIGNLLGTEEGLIKGGAIAGKFDLSGHGNNLSELARGLNGSALVTTDEAKINKKVLATVSQDMLTSILKDLVTKDEKESSTFYQCGVAGLKLEKGVVNFDRSITLQGRRFNLGGWGKLDLNTGRVNITVRPKAKKGLGVSIASIIGGFKIKGHFAMPNFGLAGGGIASTLLVGSVVAGGVPALAASGVATGGISTLVLVSGTLISGIFDRLTASEFSCKNTLSRIGRQQAKPAAK